MSDKPIDTLIRLLARLPGLGPRSARRIALHMITHQERVMQPMVKALTDVADSMVFCTQCGNLDTQQPCAICEDPQRDQHTLCVVEDVSDLWAMERCRLFHGRYHILGGTLSVLEGRGPEQLRIPALVERVVQQGISEIVLATNATVDGQTTAHYITEQLKHLPDLTISRLAQGIPIGGELDYMDEGTLGAALKARRPF